MKKIFRNKDNDKYWDDRWRNVEIDLDGFKNLDMYPIKYARLAVEKFNNPTILEAGCGTGRVYFHYKNQGYNIFGIEYSKVAVENILKKEKNSQVTQGSIVNLPYGSNFFDIVFAFGLYHNIEDINVLKKAFSETKRVLKNGGLLVASVRFDSLENSIIEYIAKRRIIDDVCNKFHRWHFDLEDLKLYLEPEIKIKEVFYVRNVSFLFKFNFFRANKFKKKVFDERKARIEGFELNFIGRIIDNLLHKVFPKYFSNLLVVVGEKV